MKILIICLPESGRTTIAKVISQQDKSFYISGFDWVKSTFRSKKMDESKDDYDRALNDFVKGRIKINPYLFVDNIYDIMDLNKEHDYYIVDGINSPKDFVHLFDYNKDVALFLNRTDAPDYIEGQNHLGVNIMRDYCLWLATMDLLPKARWLEYYFPIPGDPSADNVKVLGQKNTVTITKSVDKTIALIKEALWNSTLKTEE